MRSYYTGEGTLMHCDVLTKGYPKGRAINIWLINFAMQQKLTLYCKVTVLQ